MFLNQMVSQLVVLFHGQIALLLFIVAVILSIRRKYMLSLLCSYDVNNFIVAFAHNSYSV